MVRRLQCSLLRFETKRSQRNVTRFSPVIALVFCLLFSIGSSGAQIFKSAGPTFYGDDYHTSVVDPFPPLRISTFGSSPPGESAMITAGLNQFITDNPADGSGASKGVWSYVWAGAADEAKVEAGIRIRSYFPWVVTPPAVRAANGARLPKGSPNEQGGAVLNLVYRPRPGAPAIQHLHWIQAYEGVAYGKPVGPLLDTDPATPLSAQSKFTPYYETAGFAGNLRRGGGYFVDRPFAFELEYEQNPIISLRFDLILADSETTIVNGVPHTVLTLYGGIEWGYTYTAVDVPEPSAFAVCLIGGSGFLLFRRTKGKNRVA